MIQSNPEAGSREPPSCRFIAIGVQKVTAQRSNRSTNTSTRVLLFQRRRSNGLPRRSVQVHLPQARCDWLDVGFQTFTNLRGPKIWDPKSDPYEYSADGSAYYDGWMMDHTYFISTSKVPFSEKCHTKTLMLIMSE